MTIKLRCPICKKWEPYEGNEFSLPRMYDNGKICTTCKDDILKQFSNLFEQCPIEDGVEHPAEKLFKY